MEKQIIETKTKYGETIILRPFERNDAKRVFQCWSNPQCTRYNDIPFRQEDIEEIANYDFPTKNGMHFMVVTLEDDTIVGNCRFGTRYDSKKEEMIWDFGYSIMRSDDKDFYTVADIKKAFSTQNPDGSKKLDGIAKDKHFWGKGYAQAMVEAILEIGKSEGVKYFISGADVRNFGSQKVMLKNGFKLLTNSDGSRLDPDNDYRFVLDMKNYPAKPSEKDMKSIWENHLKAATVDLEGLKEFHTEETKHSLIKTVFYMLLGRCWKLKKLLRKSGQTKDFLKKEKISNEIERLEEYIEASIAKLTKTQRKQLADFTNDSLAKWQNQELYEEDADYQQARIACCKLLSPMVNEQVYNEYIY